MMFSTVSWKPCAGTIAGMRAASRTSARRRMETLRWLQAALMCAALAGQAADAFARIAHAGARFVSRGDSSGTHVKELALWAAAGVRPQGMAWYVESGADQMTTLQLAAERGAYAIADLPTFVHGPDLGLRTLFTADSLLRNPYTLYVVRQPAPHPAARAFAAWAMRTWREALLSWRLPDGSPPVD